MTRIKVASPFVHVSSIFHGTSTRISHCVLHNREALSLDLGKIDPVLSNIYRESSMEISPISNMDRDAFPIIDSHIHLYAATHLPHLNWTADLPETHILKQQHSIDEYREASKRAQNVTGFVFVETDRKHGHDESGWDGPLEEVAFLARIAQGSPLQGEGHMSADASLLLGVVPWAPVPMGVSGLARYITQVERVFGDAKAFRLVKGFRYLLQDKSPGTMLRQDFIAGLQWLGQRGFVFDLGIDLNSGGIHQLEEAAEMLLQVNRTDIDFRMVINHFCKPKLRLTAEEAATDQDYIRWSKCMTVFASYTGTYMKLSGFFSELPSQSESEPSSISELVERARPWVRVVFKTFGPSRVMFGSDWPVCSAGGPGSKSWQHWVDLVAAILDDQGLDREEKLQVWSGTAARAYHIVTLA